MRTFPIMVPIVNSIRPIELQLNTGEEPVLVLCSDLHSYICKYMRSSASACKLACELIGSTLASCWNLPTPNIAFVLIKPDHWAGLRTPHSVSALTLGSERLEGVIDVTPTTYREIEPTKVASEQLVKIALFDFWIANEDRNANNANLLYDINRGCFVSIDYGCILNTATFDFPMSQLTSTDTILWSDLFQHLLGGTKEAAITKIVESTKAYYKECIKQSQDGIATILENLPSDWNVPKDVVEWKLNQLLEADWISEVWDNFIDNLKDNIGDE